MPIYMPLMGGHHVGPYMKPIGPWEKGGLFSKVLFCLSSEILEKKIKIFQVILYFFILKATFFKDADIY